MKYEAGLDIDAAAFINTQDEKTRRIIRSHLKSWEDDPFPGKGGDKELLNTRTGREDLPVSYRAELYRNICD